MTGAAKTGPAAALPALVFLHLPKTAGQTVHFELARVLGEGAISPVRTHTQAPPEAQFPPGYRLYSGHLDWTALDTVPQPRFVFTVLRDPQERLASFWFYLTATARAMPPEGLARRPDLQAILNLTPDAYFFGGTPAWQNFVRDHYDNFYCSYFATRRMLGRRDLDGLPPEAVLVRAKAGLGAMDAIWRSEALHALDDGLRRRFGLRLAAGRHVANAGPLPQGHLRWPALLDRFETDAARRRIADFTALDTALIAALPPPPPPPSALRRRARQILDRISR